MGKYNCASTSMRTTPCEGCNCYIKPEFKPDWMRKVAERLAAEKAGTVKQKGSRRKKLSEQVEELHEEVDHSDGDDE